MGPISSKAEVLLQSMTQPARMPSSVAYELLSEVQDSAIALERVAVALTKFLDEISCADHQDEDSIDQRGVWLALLGDSLAVRIVEAVQGSRAKESNYADIVWDYLMGCWQQARTLRDSEEDVSRAIKKANDAIVLNYRLAEFAREKDATFLKNKKSSMSPSKSSGRATFKNSSNSPAREAKIYSEKPEVRYEVTQKFYGKAPHEKRVSTASGLVGIKKHEVKSREEKTVAPTTYEGRLHGAKPMKSPTIVQKKLHLSRGKALKAE